MRIAPAVLSLLLTAASVAAQETKAPPPPDFSRAKLTQIFSDVVEPPPSAGHNVEWHAGWVDFRALNMRWRIAFLPIMAPLPGSIRGANAAPLDAFSMLGVPYAQTPRTFSDRREVNKELERINRLDRERAKIKAEPDKH